MTIFPSFLDIRHFRSKEDIWHAIYEEAAGIWKSSVFKNIRKIKECQILNGHSISDTLG
jgi:hypothetical protein